MSGGRGWPASKGCCAPTEHSSLSSSGWEVWVPGTARNGDRGLTVDTTQSSCLGQEVQFYSAKPTAEAPTYPATVMVLLLITLESLAGGGRGLFQNSAVCAAKGPSQGVPLQQ